VVLLSHSAEADYEDDEPSDVLLIEAGRILADTLAITGVTKAEPPATAQR